MTIRWLLAALHLLALGIGLGAVWVRGNALRGQPDKPALQQAFLADTFWGIAAALWIVTGLLRAGDPLTVSLESALGWTLPNATYLRLLRIALGSNAAVSSGQACTELNAAGSTAVGVTVVDGSAPFAVLTPTLAISTDVYV